ncbi:MAG TPA: PhnD/SsuA/transferrin family substrate-binding protein [Noviherbaspirillum sp.]
MQPTAIRQSSWARLQLALLSFFLLWSTSVFGSNVVIGVFAYQGERAAVSDWSPVIDHLNTTLPAYRFRLEHFDADGMHKAIAEGRVDLVITNPGYYVTMEAEFGISRIATLVSPHVGTAAQAIGSVVLVRSDSNLHELSELAGKSVAAVAPDAFGGYLIAARELLRRGMVAENVLGEIRFVGIPMGKVIDAVQRGEADAGIIRTCLLEQMAAQGSLALTDFRVLSPQKAEGFPCASSTSLYPDWPIAVTRNTDPALAKSVVRALLAMPEANGGPSWTVPADYQPVHDLYRELRVGPYLYLRDITPEGLARRFWPWLLGFTVLLVAWVVHTIRVEYQVQRRTTELQDSLRARQAAETKMRENQEQMEHLSRLSVLGELSGSLAHEINQPLTTIGTYARTVLRLQSNGALTPDAVTEACTEIANEAERAGGIVQRIRHFSKKRAASRDPVDLVVIADEARRLIVGMMAWAPAIDILDRTEGAIQVLADGPQIQQVLLNLIKNAIDASRDLPPERQHIRIVIEPADNRLVVRVIDRGGGLGDAQLTHLFEPFFTTKPDGLGLGLPICKTIIEAHGGRLWAERNTDGVGMCFSFSLPSHEHST